MTIVLTKDQLIAMQPCDLDKRLALFGRRKSMSAAQAMKDGASIRDLLWVAQRLGRRDLCIKFVLTCAQRIAHFDKSGKAQACIDAANAYVIDETGENLRLAREARKAAYASADAAYAATVAVAYAYDGYADAPYAYAATARANANADRRAEEEALRAIFLEIFG